MKIVDEEMRAGVLNHYDELLHPLLNKQIDHMNEFIAIHMMKYKHSQDFRKAIDLMLADVLNGKLLGR